MTYVISDICGNYQKFKELMDNVLISDSDTLYILGNTVDFGDEPMELIEDISMRSNVYAVAGDRDYLAARMLYGFDKNFLLDNANLWEFTQEQLFKIANANGLFMYQSHPFRQGVKAGNSKFMHGAESFNGHFHHVNNNVPAKAFCEENSLIEMSGTDFHDPGQPVTAGIYIPKDINDNANTTTINKLTST